VEAAEGKADDDLRGQGRADGNARQVFQEGCFLTLDFWRKGQENNLRKDQAMFTKASNQVVLIGRLGDDPEFFGEDGQGARFDLAINSSFMKDGERQERVDWPTVVCWNGLAKTSCQHLAKGDRVAIAGSLRSRMWEDDDGKSRRGVEVHASSVEFLNVKSPREAKGKGRDK
jgi:single-strand DNA-binding protein